MSVRVADQIPSRSMSGTSPLRSCACRRWFGSSSVQSPDGSVRTRPAWGVGGAAALQYPLDGGSESVVFVIEEAFQCDAAVEDCGQSRARVATREFARRRPTVSGSSRWMMSASPPSSRRRSAEPWNSRPLLLAVRGHFVEWCAEESDSAGHRHPVVAGQGQVSGYGPMTRCEKNCCRSCGTGCRR